TDATSIAVRSLWPVTSRPPAATVLSCASATRSPRRSSSRSSARPDPAPITSPPPRRHPGTGAASALLLRESAPGSVRRVGEDAVGVDRGAFAQLRRIDMTGTEHMGHRQVPGQQMVGDEPAMAAPPHGFGAHEYAARGPAPVDDGGEVGPELLGQTVVGIVVET